MIRAKGRKKHIAVALVCLLLLCLVCAAFFWLRSYSITAINPAGETVSAFRSEDGAWHLFLPNGWNSEETVLRVGHVLIRSTSRGQLRKGGREVQNAFSTDGEAVELLLSNGKTAVIQPEESTLPCLQLQLNGTTLGEIHRKEKTRSYPGTVARLTDADGREEDLPEEPCEIKRRGNSIWTEKKGYQLRFTEKTSVLGMAPAKKWLLIANACDDSMMRNKLVYDLGEQIYDGFVPHFEYVDLWIDGDYRGVYLLGEKVEISAGRLELRQTPAALVELDNGFYDENEFYFMDPYFGDPYALKDSNAPGDSVLELFREKLTRAYNLLFSVSPEQLTRDSAGEYIDMESFAFTYLMTTFWQNREAVASSNFFYFDGASDVLRSGPIWDYDTCAGNDGWTSTLTRQSLFCPYSHLLSSPDFRACVQELYADNRQLFEDLPRRCQELYERIASSAEQNYLRWDTLGKPNPKASDVSDEIMMADSFPEAVTALRDWLEKRLETYSVPLSVQIRLLSDNGERHMRLISEEETAGQISFAVWSDENGQDDLIWYPAEKQHDGTWCCEIDLNMHLDSGVLSIHTYDVECGECLSTNRFYIVR